VQDVCPALPQAPASPAAGLRPPGGSPRTSARRRITVYAGALGVHDGRERARYPKEATMGYGKKKGGRKG